VHVHQKSNRRDTRHKPQASEREQAMNALNDLYNAPRSSLKRKLSRKRAETKDATQADEPQEAPKVLGPYANNDKWRLVVKSGDKRKSLVFDTVEQAETAKEQPTCQLRRLCKADSG
jgi:hypothetical protein